MKGGGGGDLLSSNPLICRCVQLDLVLQAFEGSPLTEKDALASATGKTTTALESLFFVCCVRRVIAPLSPSFPTRLLLVSGSSRASFPKFLTSQRLISLQLRDPEFRRHVLLQALVVFQVGVVIVVWVVCVWLGCVCDGLCVCAFFSSHLCSFLCPSQAVTQLKPPKDRFQPSRAQLEAVRVTSDRCDRLLRATPPFGAVFARDVRETLGRELHWIGWKEARAPGAVACAAIEKKRVDLSAPLELEPEEKKPGAGKMMGRAQQQQMQAK
jgi:hypothetical protein